MPQTTLGRGNELYDWVIGPASITWSGSVSTVSASELTATVNGLQVGDVIAGMQYNPPAGTATTATGGLVYGLSYTNLRVTAANTLGATWQNSTGGGLTPPSANWTINILRLENPNNLPLSAA
jgi:hypothetical protein